MNLIREIWDLLGTTAFIIVVAVLFFFAGYFVGATENPQVVYIPKPSIADRPFIKQRTVVTEDVEAPKEAPDQD